MIKDVLNKLKSGKDLTREEAVLTMDTIMEGKATHSHIVDFLVALKEKGEQPSEVAGFVESMRNHSVRIQLDDKDAVDCVGTGGDGSHTFNISTASGIVAAAAGVTVAKHGNRAVSSSCGSADLLEATGADINLGPERIRECIHKVGFGFMFAPGFHPAMKHAAGPRKELGVRTVFNILGPMTNPAGVRRLLLGVYDKALMHTVADVLRLTGAQHVIIVHSHDGLDELSVNAPTDCCELKNGAITEWTISPEDVGLATHPEGALNGGNATENLSILTDILSGTQSAYRDAVLFNAGAMIHVADKTATIVEGVAIAAEAVDSGAAKETLRQWVEFTRN